MMTIARFFEFLADCLPVILVAGVVLGSVATVLLWLRVGYVKQKRFERKYAKLERRMAKIDA